MSGNVWEWEDSCETSIVAEGCHLRGGSFHNDGGLACGDEAIIGGDGVLGTTGFRCCAE